MSERPVRVGFLTTHPIQYQVPVLRMLADAPEIDLAVFYCLLPNERQQGAGFGVDFRWDLPLLEGYRHVLLPNRSARPGVTTFGGCDTPDIAAVLKTNDIEVLIVNGWVVKSCLQGLWACRRLGIPCLVRGEANLLKQRRWWKRQLHGQLLRQYAACLYIGDANRDFYRSHRIPEDRLFFSPYCIENGRFAQGPARPEIRRKVRQRYGIPEDEICFLFAGKFEPKKHPLELVRVFSEASRRQGMHLLMVGDGELRTECEALAREQSLPVHLAGFVNQQAIPEAYAAADCLVLPSHCGETWGLVVNEAMAAGLPAIVSDQVGCAADLVHDGKTGWTFPYGDWASLRRCLIEAAQAPRQLQRMGSRAFELIQTYSPEATAAGIIEAVHFAGPSRSCIQAAVAPGPSSR